MHVLLETLLSLPIFIFYSASSLYMFTDDPFPSYLIVLIAIDF